MDRENCQTIYVDKLIFIRTEIIAYLSTMNWQEDNILPYVSEGKGPFILGSDLYSRINIKEESIDNQTEMVCCKSFELPS